MIRFHFRAGLTASQCKVPLVRCYKSFSKSVVFCQHRISSNRRSPNAIPLKKKEVSDAFDGERDCDEREMDDWLVRACPYTRPVLESRELQRLKCLHQLGCAAVVWNALHTRYDHSVGVSVLAYRIGMSLRRRYGGIVSLEDVKYLVLSSLLHDSGHGPFSHVYDDHVAAHVGDITHEEHSILIADRLLRYKIGEHGMRRIRHFICPSKYENPNPRKSFLGTVLSAPAGHVDVDRLDYIVRDLFSLGCSYLLPINLDAIVNTCYIYNNAVVIVSDPSTVHAIEMCRFWLHSVILNNPIVKGADAEVARFMTQHDTTRTCTDLEVARQYVLVHGKGIFECSAEQCKAASTHMAHLRDKTCSYSSSLTASFHLHAQLSHIWSAHGGKINSTTI
jgi:hypothetical protein